MPEQKTMSAGKSWQRGSHIYTQHIELTLIMLEFLSKLCPYPSREISDHVYDELKKVLILAGAFFFITIVCVMSKLQVGTEDVLRWSPVVWLLGVCVAGTFMNLIFYCQKKYRERKQRQRDQQEELLFSLAIPRSYPCLAPAPHINCCRAPRISIPDRGLPSYEDVITHKLEDHSLPPNYSDAVSMLSGSMPVSGQTPNQIRYNQQTSDCS
ncbi:unnamed protein product [Haemonchus placei]|uniref:Neur_chan_memb domain-containing protein n=1 Tax=Haemonchus placei TaxID=6290 RepID=A0A158QLM1_HAEPC|nr:unnamed protein product [Haemonchus placei]